MMNIAQLILKHGASEEEVAIVNDLCAVMLMAGMNLPEGNDRTMLIAFRVLAESIGDMVASPTYPKSSFVNHMLPMGKGVH